VHGLEHGVTDITPRLVALLKQHDHMPGGMPGCRDDPYTREDLTFMVDQGHSIFDRLQGSACRGNKMFIGPGPGAL
jgi:hypothetical protein